MKKQFKGDIVITDPCYIGRLGTFEDRLGINILTPTGVGDWSCTVRKVLDTTKDAMTYANELENSFWEFWNVGGREEEKKFMALDEKSEIIGRFSADSGSTGVFLLSDILSIRPDFVKKIPAHCYTVIEDFSGTVEWIVTPEKNNKFILIGQNGSYITIQETIG